MQPQRNGDGDSYEPRTPRLMRPEINQSGGDGFYQSDEWDGRKTNTPLVRLGQGDYAREIHEVDLDREPTGATAAYCFVAFVLAVGFILGAAVGMWIGGAA